jgi:hypothetical protein
MSKPSPTSIPVNASATTVPRTVTVQLPAGWYDVLKERARLGRMTQSELMRKALAAELGLPLTGH